MDNFLPENYEVPEKASGYMRFKNGVNRFRVLDHAIIGYEWWENTEDGGRKPFRVHNETEIPAGAEAKHFWAFPVWNYDDKKVQILEITQSTIQKMMMALIANKKWGSPIEYDIVISKTGEKLETEYQLTPDPKEPLAPEITKAYKETYIDLQALYAGTNPFEKPVDPKQNG